MCVGRVLGVHGALVGNECIGCNPGGNSKRWDADAEASEVVGDVVTVGFAAEGDAVVRGRDAGWGWDMVSETAVFVKVDDQEPSGRVNKWPLRIQLVVARKRLTGYPSRKSYATSRTNASSSSLHRRCCSSDASSQLCSTLG